MGSTICVRCGANLIPYSYCDTSNDILFFTCSSCFMRTDERIHAYCSNISMMDSNNDVYLQEAPQIMDNSNSSRLTIGDNHVNTHLYLQNQLNDKIRDSRLLLSLNNLQKDNAELYDLLRE
jgi:transcription elongation factor Elf1